MAIDGPAAAGKSMLASRLAERFGFAWIDTGVLYRAAALIVLREAGRPRQSDSGDGSGAPRCGVIAV